MVPYILQLIGYAALVVLGAVAAAATLWVKYKKGADKALHESVSNWQQLADSRLAIIKEQKQTMAEQAQELASYKQHLDECAALRDEFAKSNLRLQAREQLYQRCINRLEIRLNIDPTNFDDPIPKGLLI